MMSQLAEQPTMATPRVGKPVSYTHLDVYKRQILGTAARSGRNKVTIITSPDISDLGAWLEQLLAESTGKIGKGIIPVDREALAAPEIYGNDRVFAYIHTEHATEVAVDAKVAALELSLIHI